MRGSFSRIVIEFKCVADPVVVKSITNVVGKQMKQGLQGFTSKSSCHSESSHTRQAALSRSYRLQLDMMAQALIPKGKCGVFHSDWLGQIESCASNLYIGPMMVYAWPGRTGAGGNEFLRGS